MSETCSLARFLEASPSRKGLHVQSMEMAYGMIYLFCSIYVWMWSLKMAVGQEFVASCLQWKSIMTPARGTLSLIL